MGLIAGKASISFDPTTLERARECVSKNTEYRSFSAFVNYAVEQQLKVIGGREFIADLERELGPIPAEAHRWAADQWPG